MAKATKTTSNSLTRWDAELSRLAQQSTQIVQGLGGTGAFIKTRGGFSFQGAAIPGNKFNAVVLAHVLHNAYFTGKFDPDTPAIPDCYAFGDPMGDPDYVMAPHSDSSEPQSEACAGCPQNEFGTADVGRGKACKNGVRIALITQGDLEDVSRAELAYLQLPPTSGPGWAAYVKDVAETLRRPPLGVITEFEWKTDPKHQFHITARLVEQIDDPEQIGALLDRGVKEAKAICFPYVQIEKATPAPKKSARKSKF